MDFRNLDSFIDSVIAMGIPTADIMLWQNHEEIHRYSAGAEELPDPDGLYYMYSISKVITCTAAMTLVEQGKFLLDSPIKDYMPEFADVTVDEGDNGIVPARRKIRVRDLFCMTAGFNYNLTSAQIRQVQDATGGRAPTREIMGALARTPLSFQPGKKFQYSLCHDVLAGLCEAVTCERFADFVKRVIFDPLGMKNSYYHTTPDILDRMVTQYRFNDRTGRADDMGKGNMYVLGSEYDSGGAGVISCMHDMMLFTDALANGGVGANGARIISRASIDLMRTPMLTEEQRSSFVWAQLGSGYSYGLGVRTCVNPSFGLLSPVGEFGWGGAAGSLMIISPENHLAGFYCQHMLNNKEAFIHPRLWNIVFSTIS